jgi:hypothetical protein
MALAKMAWQPASENINEIINGEMAKWHQLSGEESGGENHNHQDEAAMKMAASAAWRMAAHHQPAAWRRGSCGGGVS